MNKRFSIILEIIWLILAVTCLILGFHRTYKLSIRESYMYFILAILAFAMYSLRRYVRKSQKNR